MDALERRLANIEAELEAHGEVLVVAVRAFIGGNPSVLRDALTSAMAYTGPSHAKKSLARIAQSALAKT